MKKIIIALLLGCFSLPLNAMQEGKISQTKEKSKRTQLSKLDKVKIGAAAFGSAWFGLSALLTYPALADLVENEVILAPWLSVILPSYALVFQLLECDSSEKNKNIFFSSTTLLSAIISGALGIYAYKKLKAAKNKQSPIKLTRQA